MSTITFRPATYEEARQRFHDWTRDMLTKEAKRAFAKHGMCWSMVDGFPILTPQGQTWPALKFVKEDGRNFVTAISA